MKYLIIALLSIIGFCSTSCTKAETEAPVPQSVTEAEKQGRADAQALSDANYTADRDLHAALLAVKAREWRMRSRGDEVAAGAYIEAFGSHLKEIDQPLAQKVL